MPSWTYQNRSAERTIFRERFRNLPTVHSNGGTLIGSPFVKDGIQLDGLTQYSQYVIHGGDLAGDEITFVARFVPLFDTDDNANSYIYTTDGSTLHRVIKMLNSQANTLRIYMGGTLLVSIAEATYSPFWNVGEVNCLVVSTTSGNTSAWLNGNNILLGDSTTYTRKFPNELYIGADFAGANNFEGEFKSLSIHEGLWTQADVDAYQQNALFTYPNRAEVWADMSQAIVDGSNDRTPDKSRNGNLILLGDGSGTGVPTWEAPGFIFDGIDDYFTLPSDPTGTFTVAWKRRNESVVFESDLTTWDLIGTSGDFTGLLDYLVWWPFTLSPIQKLNFEYSVKGNR